MSENPLFAALPPEMKENMNASSQEQTESKGGPKPPGAESTNPLDGASSSPNPLAGVGASKPAPGAPSPVGPSNSEFTINLGDGPVAPDIEAISKKRVEDLTQEELRKVYLKIGGTPDKYLYSASTVSDIEKYGEPRSFSKQSESLFIGDHVHLAMETKGANLHKLVSFEDLGPAPEAPDMELTKSEVEMIEVLARGGSRRGAVWTARNNKVTREVSEDLLNDFDEIPVEDCPTEIVALDKLAKKETAKITDKMVDEYKDYLKKYDFYQERKNKLIQGDKIVVDELDYRTSSAARIIESIERAYKGLKNSIPVMEVYDKGLTGKGDIYTEFVVLWKHTLPSGELVNCKSMFDRMVIDKESKVVTISDIKTHSKFKSGFISSNYFGYSYWRSMSFYKAAVEYMLKEDMGEDPNEWTVRAVLLPVSTASGEVGCSYDTNEVGPIDLHCGKYGGFIKPTGSKFDVNGAVQIFLDQSQYDWLKTGGLINEKSLDLYRKGWSTIIHEHQARLKPSMP